jgi:type VI secretion system secreted protein Hcp
MATDAYMFFQGYDGNYLQSESRVKLERLQGFDCDIIQPFVDANKGTDPNGPSHLFEVTEYSFDLEQTLGIGSQSTGAGIGKVQFNPFSITRLIDCASPILYKMACAGKSFETVGLGVRKSAGAQAAGVMYLAFTFKLVAVKTWALAHSDDGPSETVTFEYGGLCMQYSIQAPSGKLGKIIPGGWNRVRNIAVDDPTKSGDWSIK